jgi:hypothetical protein
LRVSSDFHSGPWPPHPPQVKTKKLGILNNLTQSQTVDATWIFTGHEAFLAEQKGIALTLWTLADYDVPCTVPPAHQVMCGSSETNRVAVFLGPAAQTATPPS